MQYADHTNHYSERSFAEKLKGRLGCKDAGKGWSRGRYADQEAGENDKLITYGYTSYK